MALLSLLSALAEAAVLGLIATLAAALVTEDDSVLVELGPLSGEFAPMDLVVVAVALAVVRAALQLLLAYLSATIAGRSQANFRAELFTHYSGTGWESKSLERFGQLQELLTGHIAHVARGTLQLSAWISSLLALLVLLTSAVLIQPLAAAAVAGVSSVLIVALRPLNRLAHASSQDLAKRDLRFASLVSEAVVMSEETTAFGVDDRYASLVHCANELVRRSFTRVFFIHGLGPALYQGTVLLLLTMALGWGQSRSALDPAAIGAVVLLLVRAGAYGQQLQGLSQALWSTSVYVERLASTVKAYRDATPRFGGKCFPGTVSIQLANVAFSFPGGHTVLDDINLSIAPGESCGIVGPSGAGKTTLVQILLRLYRPAEGAYKIGDVDAFDIDRDEWHRQVAYLPQNGHLFSGSVLDNVRFFRDLDEEAVYDACRRAHVHDEILALPDQYETLLGARSDGVSGGQRQRICLARALADDPSLLILDEPTSALDPRSEALVQKTLEETRGRTTTIVIAHRLTTIRTADRLIALVGGRIVDDGSPDEVLLRNPSITG